MSRRNRSCIVIVSMMPVLGILAAPPPAVADCLGDTSGWVCDCENSTSNPTICVKWTEGTPEQPFDFDVDFACAGCSSAPAVVLFKQNVEWSVWSYDNSASDVGDIGDITISASGSLPFFLSIEDDAGGAGARDVKSINMTDAGWTGHSNITGGSIDRDLGGLTLVKDSGGNGGRLNLTVCGDVGGVWTVPVLEALTIGGNIRSGAEISIGNTPDITPDAFLTVDGNCVGDITITRSDNLASFTVEGDLSGAIVVEEILVGSKITVNGSISSTGLIDVNDMKTFGTGIPLQYSKITLNTEDDATTTTAGTIDFANGIPEDQNVHVFGDFTSTATIDLRDKAVYGYLVLERGGSGDILNGGEIDASHCQTSPVPVCLVRLGAKTTDTYSGRAEFLGVTVDGLLQISNLDGEIAIGGTMAGETVIGEVDAFGDVVEPGNIDLGGEISIRTNLIGTLNVSGNHNGDILIGEGVTGVLEVGEKLGATGRILIEGLADGAIVIGQETVRTSLIRAIDGLGTNGSITINDGAGSFNANGTIHLGPTAYFVPPPITFDGSILIKKDGNGSGGGVLFGAIDVIGCHDPADQLDICICCTLCTSNPVSVIQDDCDPLISTPEWACLSGCP